MESNTLKTLLDLITISGTRKFLDDHTFCGGLLCGKQYPEDFVGFDNNFWNFFLDDHTFCDCLFCGK